MASVKMAITVEQETLRLVAECAKLDPKREQMLAEEDLGADAAAWPEY